MKKALAGAGLLVAVAFLTGCPEEDNNNNTADGGPACTLAQMPCACTKSKDCPSDATHRFMCVAKQCTRICFTQAECDTGDVCEEQICMKPGCATDAECNDPNMQCLGGTCAPKIAATDVKSCLVQPANAVLHQGAAKTFSVLARDANGTTIAYKGNVTWTAEPAGGATTTDTGIAANVTGGATAGAVQIKAAVGSVNCTAAAATNFLAPGNDQVRVLALDMLSNLPVAGAKVVVKMGNTTLDGTTGADGSVLIAGGAGSDNAVKDVSVFTDYNADGSPKYSWVTVLGVRTNDIAIFLNPAFKKTGFKGDVTPRYFDQLAELGTNVHLGLFGSSIAGNLTDVSLDTLIGELKDTEIDYGSGAQTVPLPSGVVLGIGEQMFKTDAGKEAGKSSHYEVFASPGLRAVWGLGGNTDLSNLVGALAPVISGGTENLNVGQILNTILPLLGKLESGALTGLQTPADDTLTDISTKMLLTTPLRIKTTAVLPQLPTFTFGGTTAAFEGAIILGGAFYPPQGLIPLGVTAGVDTLTKEETPDQWIDNPGPCTGTCPKGEVNMPMAPLHNGLETGRYTALALALSFSSFTDDTAPLVMSGSFKFPTNLAYANGPTRVEFGSFLNVTAQPTLTEAERKVEFAHLDGATYHKLHIGDAQRGFWDVYFDATGAPSITVPTPPTGLDGAKDRFNRKLATGDALPDLLLQSMAMTNASANSFNDLVKFDGLNLDDVSLNLTGFSAREIVRQ